MSLTMLIQNARILTPHGFTVGNIFIENGIIQSIDKHLPDVDEQTKIYDAKFKMVLPGFIDIHTHGANGLDVNTATTEDYEVLNNFFASQGTTSYLPTVITDSKETMLSALTAIAEAKSKSMNGSQILGIHMEGPHLCSKFKGAMPEQYLVAPNIADFNELQQAADGNIVHVTIAPDTNKSVEFVRHLVRSGVSVAIGHTDASYEQAMECIFNGASHSTHTFNAMKMMHHRAPAVVGAVLDSDITAEIICDGEHVDPAIVRVLKNNKGIDRIVGVTDSIMAAGLPDGRYHLGVNEIDVENGNAWLSDEFSTRAGSTLLMIDAFKNMIEFTDISIADASKIFSRNPAKVIGVDKSKGEIRIGMDADFVVLDDDLNLSATIIMGKLCHENKSLPKPCIRLAAQKDEEEYLIDNDVFFIY